MKPTAKRRNTHTPTAAPPVSPETGIRAAYEKLVEGICAARWQLLHAGEWKARHAGEG